MNAPLCQRNRPHRDRKKSHVRFFHGKASQKKISREIFSRGVDFFLACARTLANSIFRGTTENAVRIQISVAIITYCLVAIVQHDMRLKRSTYEVLQILSISLTDKTHLRDLFDKTNFNDVKDRFGPLIPGLFDYYLNSSHFNGTRMIITFFYFSHHAFSAIYRIISTSGGYFMEF